MQTTTFTAPDISCDGCANAIKRAIGGVKGVSEVQVDVAAKRVTVSHGAEATREDLAARLDRAGFPIAD